MIGIPFNDLRCLGTITQEIATRVQQRDHALLELAKLFPSTLALAEYIRALPQRDDFGLRTDIPKIRACSPAQRLRVPAEDPNCVERSALYLALAELIDPWPVRQLATLTLPFGRHTFPLESGAPIVLDPQTNVDELTQGISSYVPEDEDAPPEVHDAEPPSPPIRTPRVVDVNEAIDYTIALGQQAASEVRNGPSRSYLAGNAIHDLVGRGRAPTDSRTVEAIAWLIELAKQVARQHGLEALTIVHTTALAIAGLADEIAIRERQRNLSFAVNGHTLAIPSWVSGLGSVVGRIGLDVGAEALAPGLAGKLAAMGITGKMLDLVKDDLAKDGYNLGPLDHPVGTFSSALNSINKKRAT